MQPRLSLRIVVVLSLVACSLAAQSPEPGPGFRLFGPFLGTTTILVDDQGAIVHTWASPHAPRAAVYLRDDGLLLRSIETPSSLPLPGSGGGVQMVGFDGTVVWDYRYDGPGFITHHDLAPMPNGNILMIAWEDYTVAQATAMGRDPALMVGPVFRPDHVIEVEPTGPTSGNIVWEWHVTDHLIQDYDSSRANYGVVGDHPELVDVNYPPDPDGFEDWNHMNGIDYDPVNDLVVLSPRSQNEIWIIDHGTTTAVARGHSGGARGRGGDILYRWGNPEAYRAGTAADRQLFGQHNPTFIPPGYVGEGNILLFNNFPPGGFAAWEIDLPQDSFGSFLFGPAGRWGPDGPCWSYRGGFDSFLASSAERLPNGNTLICSALEGRILEVTHEEGRLTGPTAGAAPILGRESREVWSFPYGQITFHAHYYERTLWGDRRELSVSQGGTLTLGMIAGTRYAGLNYLVLGSFSGTSPGLTIGDITLPLNYDSYLGFMADNANTPPFFVDTLGTLDASGRASASITIPLGLIPPSGVGAVVHHAYLVLGSANDPFVFASNAVPMTLVP